MASDIQHQFRGALRWYPDRWRAQHEEAMLGTLLDVADAEGRTRPKRGELATLRASGLAAWIDALLPARVRDGVSAVSIATGAAFATVYLVMHSWMPWLDITTLRDGATGLSHETFGPFLNPFVVLWVVWMIALMFALAGLSIATKITLAFSVVTALLIPLVAEVTGTLWFGPRSTNLGFLSLLALMAMLGAPRRPGRLLAGVTVATCAITGYYFLAGYMNGGGDDLFFWYNPGTHVSVVLYLALSGSLALAFLLAKRPVPATVTMVSLIPWLGPWLIWSSQGDLRTTLTIIGGGAMLASITGLIVLAFHRSGIRVTITRSREIPPSGP